MINKILRKFGFVLVPISNGKRRNDLPFIPTSETPQYYYEEFPPSWRDDHKPKRWNAYGESREG